MSRFETLNYANWRVGQRVTRKTSDELGTVTEVDQYGAIKVKWDCGRTSYYHPNMPANVKMAESEKQ